MNPPSPTILDALPHRSPFRFLTDVVSIDPGTSGEGVWLVAGDEPFFQGHFPDGPIVPGVLITEALAQLSGLVGFFHDGCGVLDSDSRADPNTSDEPEAICPVCKLAHVDIRFRDSVVPPARIKLRSRVERVMGGLVQFEVEAYVGEKRIANGKLTLARTVGETDTSP